MEPSGVIQSDNVAHSSDLATPLQYGKLRFVEGPSYQGKALPVKNDKPFVFVPAGYMDRFSAAIAMNKILDAIDLTMPNLVMVVGSTTTSSGWKVQNQSKHSLAKLWTEEHCQNVLNRKAQELLTSTIDSCAEVGTWIMPQQQNPFQADPATQQICQLLPQENSPVVVGVLDLTTAGTSDEASSIVNSIKSCMVPVGSPLQAVVSIQVGGDDGNNDESWSPRPEMSHFIVFESPFECQIWKQYLLRAVPDMLLLFGDVTDQAADAMFDCVTDGSPVILLQHSHSRVDSYIRMFKHVRKFLASQPKKTDGTTITTTAVGNAPSTTTGTEAPATTTAAAAAANKKKVQNLKIPPLPSKSENSEEGDSSVNDKIDIFLATWPSNFNPKSVVLADPLLLTQSSFQKSILASITATFDLKVGDDDVLNATKETLDYAWSFYYVAAQHEKRKKKASEWLNIALTTFTLLSIVASVVYSQYLLDLDTTTATTLATNTQLLVYVATILLPLYVTSLKQQSDTNNPVVKWNAFQAATAQMESEITQFRCQIGPAYRALDKSKAEMRKPIHAIAQKIRSILMSVKPYMQDDSLVIGREFWANGSPIEDQFLLQQEQTDNRGRRGTGCLGRTSRYHQNAIEVAFPDVATPLISTNNNNDNTTTVHGDDDDDDDDDEEMANRVESDDDHYSPMTADDYINIRMKTKMQDASLEVSMMKSRNDQISGMIKLITICSGALAALSLQWAVPIVLGVSAGFMGLQEFRTYPKRIEANNMMIVRLNDLKLWWMGLSMYQQQLPHNKDRLVREGEEAILAVVGGPISRSTTTTATTNAATSGSGDAGGGSNSTATGSAD